MGASRASATAASPVPRGLAPVVWAALWHRLGDLPIQEVDERVYLDVSRNMLERHDWLDPWYFDDRYPGKPPLRMWTGAALFALLGESEWIVRLPDAVCATLATLLVWRLARRHTGGPATIAAPIVFATAPYPLSVHGYRQGMTEAMLTLLMTAAVACFLESREAAGRHRAAWTIAIGACIGAGAMTKSVVAFLAYAPMAAFVVSGWLLHRRAAGARAREAVSRSASVAAWLAAVAISILPWLAYYLSQANLAGEVRFNLVARVGEWQEQHSPWQYAIWLREGFGVMGWFLLLALAAAAAGAMSRPFDLWLVLWSLALTVPWALARVKHPWYQYPAYPAWALLLARLFFPPEVWSVAGAMGRGRRTFAAAGSILFVILASILVTQAFRSSSNNPPVPFQQAARWIRTLREPERTIAVLCPPQMVLPDERYYLARAGGKVVYAPTTATVLGLAIDEPRLLAVAQGKQAHRLVRDLLALGKEIRVAAAPVRGQRLRAGIEIPDRLLVAVGTPRPAIRSRFPASCSATGSARWRWTARHPRVD
ncbi:MAG: glycosyltransferase family 39 protein [Acidobacteriota bacterium]